MLININPWQYSNSTKKIYIAERLTTRNASITILQPQNKIKLTNFIKSTKPTKPTKTIKLKIHRPIWKISTFSKHANSNDVKK